jgi:hypothetical protein
MKFLLLSFFIAGSLHAETFRVLVRRDHSTSTVYKEVELPDLVSPDSFEGKYFRIVKGKGKETISFHDPDRELVLKAANTYYHLASAREFWVSRIGSDRPGSLPQLTVRIDISNLFDDQGHYAHDNRDPQFNNALSIPAGQTPDWVPEERQDEWGPEIWFRPKKVIDTRTLTNNLGPNPLTQVLTALEHPLINYARNQLQVSLVERLFYPQYASGSIQNDIFRFAGTIALTRFLITTSKKIDPLFLEKWFYLDTAMVPEVVYHEYAHIILSDYLKMSHSTPVLEGLADYFASAQANKRKVYAKVPGRSTSQPKDPYNKRPYTHWTEANRTASSDFVLAVLWDVRDVLGEDVTNKLVYQVRKYLTTDSATISDHLLRAILRSCDDICLAPRADKLRLYEKFSARGF